jgi:hypothetical protein
LWCGNGNFYEQPRASNSELAGIGAAGKLVSRASGAELPSVRADIGTIFPKIGHKFKL